MRVQSSLLLAVAAGFALVFPLAAAEPAAAPPQPDYAMADAQLKVELIDSNAKESFLAVRADTTGRLFVGGRESLFVYEPNAAGGYETARKLLSFPAHSWIYDVEVRGNDLYVLTMSALYLVPEGVTKRENLQLKRLVWGVPRGHVHQCFHALAWGPEGDLYIAMGDPLWYYGDFERPDHWGYWQFAVQPEGTKVPYHGVGGVFRCRPDGSQFQVVATGLRNSCGLAFDREFNLFTNDNDHESLPASYVPGRLLHVTPHAYFSWPRGWMPEKTPDRADLLQTMFDGLGRFVPVQQAYYDETLLPEPYRNNLLVARWCTRAVTRYPLAPRGASYSTSEQPLLVGQNIARPVGVTVGRGGRIFATIAHMANNEESPVYKSDLVMITRADDTPAHAFDAYVAAEAPADRLWQELSDASWHRRYAAHEEILRRGSALTDEAEGRLSKCAATDPAYIHLIWLTAAANRTSDAITALATSPDARLRTQALRAMAAYPERYHQADVLVHALRAADAHVQLAALGVCFAPQAEMNAAAWLAVMEGPAISNDTYLRQTAAFLLAERGSLDMIDELTHRPKNAERMAGILAAGFRLTVPKASAAIDDNLPLVNWPNADATYVLNLADGKFDLRTLGRLGTHTIAEHWKAAPHSADQTRLSEILQRALGDQDETNRLEAAFFLALLRDPALEPRVAEVRANQSSRQLAAAPWRPLDAFWVVGPFPNGEKGLETVHAPEAGVVDLSQVYAVGETKLSWNETKTPASIALPMPAAPDAKSVSFYAFTRLDSSAHERGELQVEANRGVRVWLNGKPVVGQEAKPGTPVAPFTALLDLQAGGNDLLVRVSASGDSCKLNLQFRSSGKVMTHLPEKVNPADLANRLREAQQSGGAIKPEFLTVDWTKAAEQGDAARGRKLFESLACAKCHAVSNDSAVSGGPSLAEAKRRFTSAYVMESVLLPGKQVSPVFKATLVQTADGVSLTGLVVKETAEQVELLLPDASRKTIPVSSIEARKLLDQSPMPSGLVRTPDELRDLIAFLLSDGANK